MTLSRTKRRFYVPPDNILQDTITIAQPEYHHIIDVIRFKEGESIILFDGRGNEYMGSIVSIDKKMKRARVRIDTTAMKSDSAAEIILVQSLIKKDKMDFIIEKATELGVSRIIPVMAERSIVKLDGENGISKISKWERITKEAAKQCGRAKIPVIDAIADLQSVVNIDAEVRIICSPADSPENISLGKILKGQLKSAAVLIGPEGGFTEDEVKLACDRGWMPFTLGKTTLRAETAAVVMLGIVMYENFLY